MFDGQDWKVEDWLMDLETATDISTEPQYLAEAKSCSLTHTLICKSLQAGKCWDELYGILQLKFSNANIHTYTTLYGIQQKGNETLAAYVHHFKTTAKCCTFDNDTVAICIFVKGLWDAHTTRAKIAKIYKKDPKLCLKSLE